MPFFLSSLDQRAFWRSATVAYVILDALYMSKLNQSWSIILIILMLLMRIVLSFVWSEFSSVGREEWCKDEEWTKAQAWGFPCHPKKYSRGTRVKAWGCPCIPTSLKSTRSLLNTVYFYCFIYYVMFLERHLFLFSVCFVLFADGKSVV